jgi:hypothetical protein
MNNYEKIKISIERAKEILFEIYGIKGKASSTRVC